MNIDSSKISAGAVTATFVTESVTVSNVQNTSIALGDSRLHIGNGGLRFEGNADQAARIFIDNVIALYDDEMRRLRAMLKQPI